MGVRQHSTRLPVVASARADDDTGSVNELADLAANTNRPLSTRLWVYNQGTGKWDRLRSGSNVDLAVLASLANTQATRTSADLVNYAWRGAIIHVKISAYQGAPTYTPSAQMKCNDGSYATIWSAAALSANGDYTYMLYPAASGGSFTAIAPLVLPRTWRLVLTVAGGAANNDATTLVDASMVV